MMRYQRLASAVLLMLLSVTSQWALAQNVVTIQAARNAGVNAQVTIEGVVTRAEGDFVRIQDSTAGITIRQTSGTFNNLVASDSIRQGTKLRIDGTTSAFAGLYQINGSDLTNFSVLAQGNDLPAIQEVTLQDIANQKEDLEAELIRVTGLELVNAPNTFSDGTTYAIRDANFSSDSVSLRIGNSGDTRLDGVKAPSGTFSFVGVLGHFDGFNSVDSGYQLLPIELSDLQTRLTLLHNNDGESELLPDDNGFGGVAHFKSLVDTFKARARREGSALLTLSSGDNFIPGPEINASLELPQGRKVYDAIAIDSIGYDALCIGNHDFDLGPDFLARFIEDVDQSAPTFLSTNLNFTNEAALLNLVNNNRIAKSLVLTQDNLDYGIVGLTTPNLPFISSIGNVRVDSMIARLVQDQIDSLSNAGVERIILISHLQGVDEDSALVSQLSDLDIVIAGGGDDLLARPGTPTLPNQSIAGDYPRLIRDTTGKEVPLVTTAGNYKYLGRLEVAFDAGGAIAMIDTTSNAYRVANTNFTDGVPANTAVQENVVDSIIAFNEAQDSIIAAITEVPLDGRRNQIRSKETNQGDLIADAFLWQARRRAAALNVPAADFAIVNGGGIRNDNIIASGDTITATTTAVISRFNNIVTLVDSVTPQRLKLILENCVSRVSSDGSIGGSGTGRFGQVAGLSFTYSADSQAVSLDGDNNVVTPGSRIIDVTLDNGTPVVRDGQIVTPTGTVFRLTTANFLAGGGDQYPIDDLPATLLGRTDQQTVFEFLRDSLEGRVKPGMYPVGGKGRIGRLRPSYTLTILHNNDGESDLTADADGGSIAQFKRLADDIRQEQAEAGEPFITLTSGDNFLPGPEIDASQQLPADEPIFDAVAIDKINYDALCLGNHDFDFGPDFLARFIDDVQESQATFLSANLDFTNEPGLQALVDNDRIAPRKVFTKQGRRIGVIGLTTPILDRISSPRNVNVNTNIAQVVNNQVSALQNDGVDIIILISHLQSVAEDTTLIKDLSGVDVVIAGGGDNLLANSDATLRPGDQAQGPYPIEVRDQNNETTYVVTTVGGYQYLGRLELTFDANGEVTGVGNVSNPVVVEGDADPIVEREVVAPVSAYLGNLDNLNVALTEVTLDGTRSLVRTQETNQGNLISDAIRWQANEIALQRGIDTAEVGLANGGGIRNSVVIAADDSITVRNTFDILPFGNLVTIVPGVTHAKFKEILENAVSRVEFTDGRFAQVSGFRFVYDTTNAARELDDDGNLVAPGERVIEVVLNNGDTLVSNGTVRNPMEQLNIAIPDFLARGGDDYPFDGAPFTGLGVDYRVAYVNYLEQELNELVTAADYPAGGEGRIVAAPDSTSSMANGRQTEVDVKLYPNPAEEAFFVRVELEQPAMVQVRVLNVLGAEVMQMQRSLHTGSAQFIRIDREDARLQNGVYLVEVTAGNRRALRRMILR